jgi:hypothetical protein
MSPFDRCQFNACIITVEGSLKSKKISCTAHFICIGFFFSSTEMLFSDYGVKTNKCVLLLDIYVVLHGCSFMCFSCCSWSLVFLDSDVHWQGMRNHLFIWKKAQNTETLMNSGFSLPCWCALKGLLLGTCSQMLRVKNKAT